MLDHCPPPRSESIPSRQRLSSCDDGMGGRLVAQPVERVRVSVGVGAWHSLGRVATKGSSRLLVRVPMVCSPPSCFEPSTGACMHGWGIAGICARPAYATESVDRTAHLPAIWSEAATPPISRTLSIIFDGSITFCPLPPPPWP